MKNFFFIFTACMLFLNVAQAQIINIPDTRFKNTLVSSFCVDTNGDDIGDARVDTNSDGQISVTEALAVTGLSVYQRAIFSLEGIQYFTNLQTLNCANNYLSTLNVQGFTNLQKLWCSHNQLPSLNVQGLTNLITLDCSVNSLPSLNVQGFTNLKVLTCQNNQIPSLNVQGLTNLIVLDCSINQIPVLNVQGLMNLKHLYCNNNQLPSLNVQGLTNLEWLGCSNNQLTMLNVQGLTNLQSLDCANNQLTTLNVQGLTNLHTLQCQNNRLTSLDVQDLTNLQILNCANNQLSSLFIKNGRTEPVNFSANANLTYICCDEAELTNIQNTTTGYGLTNCTINSYCSFTPGGIFYTIQGNNKLDANNNGCDTNDAFLPNMKYSIADSTNTGSIISNTSGFYNIPVQAGTHTIKPVLENSNYYNTSPDSIQITFPNTNGDTLTQNFCITPNGIHHDVEVTVIPVTPARPGFDATYQIVYKNKGTAIESDSLSFRFDDARVDFVSASVAPSSQRTNFLVFQYSNLQPFETRTITVTMNVNSPMETPAVNAGDILVIQAVAYPLATDEMPTDNGFGMRQIVVGSLDPNDKTCLEGDKITPDMVGQYLHYMIRFENTGTYAAENIVVRDMIDLTKFDIASLQMTKASHDCRTRILNGNQVEFIFENINLPFTEPDKHGFVAFKIKTKPTIALGDAITNKADIFFDYNFPITTNTASTQVVASLNPSEGGKPNSMVFDITPNPVTDILNLKTDITIEKCEIYDNLGRVLQSSGVQNQQINVAHLPKGSYFIKVFGGNGSAVARFVKL
jgi:uncharacterized repeat protein (TIGR01451 family)